MDVEIEVFDHPVFSFTSVLATDEHSGAVYNQVITCGREILNNLPQLENVHLLSDSGAIWEVFISQV